MLRTPRSLPEEFADVFRTAGDRVALDASGASITYADLDRAINRAAHGLLERDALRRPVAVLATHELSSVVAMLGVLAAGGVCVPVDPRDGPERVRSLLERVGIELVVADSGASHAPLDDVAEVVSLDAFSGAADHAPGVVADPEAPALVYLTSGSTGWPKVVAHTHASVVRQLWEQIDLTALTPDDRVSVLFPLAFLGSLVIFGAALLTGARACFYDIGSLGIDGLPPWLVEHGITQLNAVPSVLYALLESSERRGDVLPAIRNVGFGGEEFRTTALPSLRRAFPAARVFNSYGSQECGHAVVYVVPRDADGTAGRLPAGHVLPTYRVVVVDEAGDPVAAGECGEIVVCGPNVARGYRRGDDLTSEHISTGRDDEAGVRTGDFGLIRADGLLDVLGRLDRRVKVRGQAVDVVEVERALIGLADVSDAAVTPAVDDRGGIRLVAHVVPAPGSAPTVGGLRRGLAREIPRYAIPSFFVLASAIPLTPRGKADRAALSDAALGAIGRGAEYAAPSTPRQCRLVELFAKVLDMTPAEIGAHDDFFDLGGDSLDATEVVAAIADELGVDLSVSTLLEFPTAAALDDAIAGGPLASTTAVRLTRGAPDATPFFCVSGGEGHALGLRALARELANRGVFGIQAKGVDRRARPDRTIERRARRHVADIRRVRPHGPYLVGGHSFGGVVACEIARQLREAGETVQMLVLLDSSAPGTGSLADVVTGLQLRYPGRGIGARTRRGLRLAYVGARRHGYAMVLGVVPLNDDRRRVGLYGLNGSMSRRYRPVTYPVDVPVLMLRTAEPDMTGDPRARLPDRGWGAFLGCKVSTVDVGGGHTSMVQEPYAREAAAAIDRAFAALGV